MPEELRQSTAVVIPIGPFVDDTDGKTLEEALTVANIDVQIMQPLDTGAVPPDLVTNGDMGASGSWTENGWSISAGVANSVGAQDTNLDQTLVITENVAYEVVFEIKARSAGTVTPILGGVSGTAQSAVQVHTEIIIAGSGSLIRFDAIGFTGTIDDVVIKQVPIPITPAASGSVNDMVLCRANTGTYWLELTAAQVGILGNHMLSAFISGALIVWKDFAVITQNAWDSRYGSDKLQVDVTQVGGTAQTAGDLAALINTIDDLLDTEVAAIKTVVDGLQTDLDNGTDGLGALKALIDTVNTDLSNGTDGLGALKTLIDTVNTDLSNGTDGLGALKTLIDGLNNISVANILAVAQTESYAAERDSI
ncbi:hypothetical protein LCGC14_1729150 [marine sediment metagenome]|uniref:Uncharacterized protein n=1 Tax=marine sediment metagenome TaxID=412755 RepID=A0A0F9H9V1_9ZZZZ